MPCLPRPLGELSGLWPSPAGARRDPSASALCDLHPVGSFVLEVVPQCGEATKLTAGLCARCALRRRLTELLGGPNRVVRPELQSHFDSLATECRFLPQAVTSSFGRVQPGWHLNRRASTPVLCHVDILQGANLLVGQLLLRTATPWGRTGGPEPHQPTLAAGRVPLYPAEPTCARSACLAIIRTDSPRTDCHCPATGGNYRYAQN